MRTFVTRVTRPRLSCKNGIGQNGVIQTTRHIDVAPARSKLSFNDVFTILLAPVLATAIVADTTFKDKKRDEWNKRLEEVQNEIERIQEREQRIWSNLQFRSVRNGALIQRRAYSSQARHFVVEDEETSSGIHFTPFSTDIALQAKQHSIKHKQSTSETAKPTMNSQDSRAEFTTLDLDKMETTTMKLQDSALDFTSHHTDKMQAAQVEAEVMPAIREKWQHYEKLIASKLAIEMILHLRTGKSVLNRLPSVFELDTQHYPVKLESLVQQLHRINARLTDIMGGGQKTFVPPDVSVTEEQRQLHHRITVMSESCKRGSITVKDLVYGYAQAVATARTSPRLATYTTLLEAVSAVGNESISYTIMGAIKTSQQTLGAKCIGLMLMQHGKHRDVGKLEDFLRKLTKKEGGLRTDPWHQVFVRGAVVYVPSVPNAQLLSILLRVNLQCGMLQKAEAYAALLFRDSVDSRLLPEAFRNILKYSAQQQDWEAGRRWMHRASCWMALFAKEQPLTICNVIFSMLELCVACDRRSKYETILCAAVAAGIPSRKIDRDRPEFFAESTLEILDDWENRMIEQTNQFSVNSENFLDKAVEFQKLLAKGDRSITPFVGETRIANLVDIAERQSLLKLTHSRSKRRLFTPDKILKMARQGILMRLRKQIAALIKTSNEHQSKTFKQEQEIEELKARLGHYKARTAKARWLFEQPAAGTQRAANQLAYLHLLTDHQDLQNKFDETQRDMGTMKEEIRYLKKELKGKHALVKQQTGALTLAQSRIHDLEYETGKTRPHKSGINVLPGK